MDFTGLMNQGDLGSPSGAATQAKPSQAKVLTGGGDLREAQVDVPLSVSHSCV